MILSLGDSSREMGSASSWRIFLLLVALLQELEADALCGSMLVDEHQPLLALRHDVELLDLAQDPETGTLRLYLRQSPPPPPPDSRGRVLCSQLSAMVACLTGAIAHRPGTPPGISSGADLACSSRALAAA